VQCAMNIFLCGHRFLTNKWSQQYSSSTKMRTSQYNYKSTGFAGSTNKPGNLHQPLIFLQKSRNSDKHCDARRVGIVNAIFTMSSQDDTLRSVPAPGMGKWNRSKRRAQKKSSPMILSKRKISKVERREKYTAIAKERQMRKQQKDLTCFQCRQKGHTVQFCALVNIDDSNDATKNSTKVKKHSVKPVVNACCYKCGSMEHSLAKCPKRVPGKSEKEDTDLPFATCFICQRKGHLASQCSQNEHGIYVNGGQCKHCSSIYHRAFNCPNKRKNQSASGGVDKGSPRMDGIIDTFDASELLEEEDTGTFSESMKEKEDRGTASATKKKRVVNF
jgi:zinc finger CCHC domain-containing protein 9